MQKPYICLAFIANAISFQIRMKNKRIWTAPQLKDTPIFFEVSLYAGTR